MGLSNDLMSQFAKAIVDKKTESETTVYGVVTEYDGGRYIKLDGSDRLIPMPPSTADVMPDDRVSIKIKNHTATITGNVSSPAARVGSVEEIDGKLAVYIPRIDADHAVIENLDVKYATITELDAVKVRTDTLEANDVTVNNKLTANEAEIKSLRGEFAEFDRVNADYVDATNAAIDNLDAKYAKIDTLMFGSASGDVIQSTFANMIIAQLGDAQIESAMIKDVAADKITAGKIVTNNVTVESSDGKLLIADETIQIRDENNQVRVQIGEDAEGDYSIYIWDAEGNLMFDATGITEYAVKKAIIKDNMIADNANISAGKIDMESLFTEINNGVRTIKSSKIYFNDEEQTLDVAFKELSDDVSSHGSWISMNKEVIESKVWEQYADKVTGDLRSEYSEYKQTTEEFKASVRSTYATKEELDNIDIGDIEIGGRNLLTDTNSPRSVDHFITWNPDGISAEISYSNSETDIVTDYTGVINIYIPYVQNVYVFYKNALNGWLKSDTNYIVSFDARFNCMYVGDGDTFNVQIGIGNTQSQNMQTPFATTSEIDPWLLDGWQHVTCKLTTGKYIPANTPLTEQALCINFGESVFFNTLDIKNIKLEEGTVSTAWTPAPEDNPTKGDIESVRDEFADLYVTKEGIGAIVGETYATKGEVETKIGEMALTKDNFKVTIGDTYTTKAEVQSEIANLALTKDNFEVTIGDTYATKEDLSNIDVDFEVGGRNYLLGTNEDMLTYTFSGWQVYLINKFQNVTTFDVSTDVIPKLIPGQKVTLSAYIENAAGTEDVGLMLMLYKDENGSTYKQYTSLGWPSRVIAPGESGVAYVTATIGDDVPMVTSVAIALRHNAGTATSSTANIRSVKLELGDVVTDWSPAPEDMASNTTLTQTANDLTLKINSAAKTATNYLNASGQGLVVGDHTAGTLKNNVLIGSDGVYVRNGTTNSATFKSNAITLGQKSQTASVDMLDGVFKIAYVLEHNGDLDKKGGFGVFGKKGDYERLAFQPVNENGNLTLGYGGYAAAKNDLFDILAGGDYEGLNKSGTHIYGNSVKLRSAGCIEAYVGNDDFIIYPYYDDSTINKGLTSAAKGFKPYFRTGDTIDVNIDTAGFLTNSGKDVAFTIPLSRPVVCNPTITATSTSGFKLRQNEKYTHGSAASVNGDTSKGYVNPDSYTASLTHAGIRINARFTSATNAVNNAPIGVKWVGQIKLT